MLLSWMMAHPLFLRIVRVPHGGKSEDDKFLVGSLPGHVSEWHTRTLDVCGVHVTTSPTLTAETGRGVTATTIVASTSQSASRSSSAVAKRASRLRFWVVWLLPPLVVIALLLGGEVTFMDSDSEFSYRHLEVGEVLIRVAEPLGGQPFQNLSKLSLAHDESGFYVLDSFAGRIHRLNVDGTIQASMGSLGEGPGEMGMPISISAVEEGVWALDSRNATALLFGPDGELLKTLTFADNPATAFAPLDRELVVPGFVSPSSGENGAPLLAHVSDGEVRSIANDGIRVPDLLSGSGLIDRIQGWVLAPLSENEVAIFLNGSVLSGWRLSLSQDYREVLRLEPIPIPGGIVDFVRNVKAPDPELRLRPLTGVRVVDEDIWVMTNGLGPDLFGFTASLHPGDNRVSLVYPGDLTGEWIMDAIVLSDRVVAITATEFIVARLHPVVRGPDM